MAKLNEVVGGRDHFSTICPTKQTCAQDTIQDPTWADLKGFPWCEGNWTLDFTCTPSNYEGHKTCWTAPMGV